MPVSDPDIQAFLDQAAKNIDVEASAVIVMNGFAARIAAAVAAASSLSAADRATIQAEVTAMQNSATVSAAAIAANTPAA